MRLILCAAVLGVVLPAAVYYNPILPGDFSDLDAIRVDTDYYAISSTLHLSPGMAVLHSKDLVNWKIISHVVADLNSVDPELDWSRMNRYGRGIWAGAIRHHAGKFWVYFNVPDTGFFVSTAADPAGPWSPVHNLWRVSGWDDPCPFWDDDGQGYLVASNFSDGYKVHLFRMSADGKSLMKESDRVIHRSKGSEANKLYKINGVYFHLFSDVKAEGRVVEMGRSRSLAGPWEIRQLIHVNPKVDKEPNQGALIQLPSGKWFFLTHQGTGDWEGRAAALLPVTWIDGWPVIGEVGADGTGNMVWSYEQPVPGYPKTDLVRSDEFDRLALTPEWEWNHQPRAGKWSLTERSGFLRLHAFPAVRPGIFWTAGNTLSQRSMRTRHNEATVKLELGGMAEGQRAGIVHFGHTYCTLGVTRTAGAKTLTFDQNGRITPGPELHHNSLWLRSTWDFDGHSNFSYSLDGRKFAPFGDEYQLTWGAYRGDRIGVFTFNDKADSGYVDVDWFHYTVASASPAAAGRVVH